MKRRKRRLVVLVQERKCKCGAAIKGDYGQCYDCWSKSHKPKPGNANFADSSGFTSKAVESKQISSTNRELVKPDFDASFDDETKLLGACVDAGILQAQKIGKAGLPTSAETAARIANSLFIQIHKNQRW